MGRPRNGRRAGDVVASEYYVWADAGALETRSSTFEVVAVVPLDGAAADPTSAPATPGLPRRTASPTGIRRFRSTSPACFRPMKRTGIGFAPLPRRSSRSRWVRASGARDTAGHSPPVHSGERSAAGPGAGDLRARLGASIDPLAVGYAIRPVRTEALAASAGATDFGEYFLYFSFFLLISALLLSALLFRLGIEQRARELGVLQAVGWPVSQVRRLFLAEGAMLSAAGAALGAAGTIGYAALIMWGLRTWWVEAVGTTALTLRPSPAAIGAGMLPGSPRRCLYLVDAPEPCAIPPRALLRPWGAVGRRRGRRVTPPRAPRLPVAPRACDRPGSCALSRWAAGF